MVETVTINGTEVEVRETEYGYEASERQSFVDYLRENTFTQGGYVFEEHGDMVDVAEHDDGMGLIIEADLRRAVTDTNIRLVEIDNGWLVLADER